MFECITSSHIVFVYSNDVLIKPIEILAFEIYFLLIIIQWSRKIKS